MCLALFSLIGCTAEEEPINTCEHIWKNASCAFPKTCYLCEETQGGLGDHQFARATCTEAAKCLYCDAVNGEALGHSFRAATCLNRPICSNCGLFEGDRLGHEYAPATCTKPATCIRCPNTGEEKALGHSFRLSDTTCALCSETVTITSTEELSEFLNGEINFLVTPYGKINISFKLDENNTYLTIYISSSGLYVTDAEKNLAGLLSTSGENYERSKEAILAVLDFQMELAKLTESVAPGKKILIGFFEDGYQYPGLGLGYNSHMYFPFQNYGGKSIAGLTEDENGICDWFMLETDPFVYCSQVLNMTPCRIHADIRAARPDYHLFFNSHPEGLILG